LSISFQIFKKKNSIAAIVYENRIRNIKLKVNRSPEKDNQKKRAIYAKYSIIHHHIIMLMHHMFLLYPFSLKRKKTRGNKLPSSF